MKMTKLKQIKIDSKKSNRFSDCIGGRASRNMIKIIAVGSMMAFLLAGCGEADSEVADAVSENADAVESIDTESGTAESGTAESMEDIYQEIAANVALASPIQLSADYVYNMYGIDLTTLKDYAFYGSEVSTSAETIILVEANDEAEVSEIQESLQKILDYQAMQMEDYLPEQYDIVCDSSVKTKGNYVWLVISESADQIEEIIEKDLQ